MSDTRENCFYLNETIRNTMRVLEFLTETQVYPVTAADVADFTNLPEEFCFEVLVNLAFDEYVRETNEGFQTLCIKIERLKPHTHKILTQSFTDRAQPSPRIRDKTGEWQA